MKKKNTKSTQQRTKNNSSKKLRVGILFGGRSGEHEVSLNSATSILHAIDSTKYEIIPIGITKQGHWVSAGEAQHLLAGKSKAVTAVTGKASSRSIQPSASADIAQQNGSLVQSLDVIFPVLHGTFGEDGTIQGLFEIADIAYVGSGVLGSATGMDKAAMKQLFAAAGLPQTPHINLLRSEWKADPKRCTKRIEKNCLTRSSSNRPILDRRSESAKCMTGASSAQQWTSPRALTANWSSSRASEDQA